MENFNFGIPEKRPAYVEYDPDKMVPEIVEDRTERLKQVTYREAAAFVAAEADGAASPESRARVFTEQILSQLDTETYLKVWAKGSPFFASHVSRHGFRDHAGMVYHTGGMNEFSDSAFRMLADQKQLRPPLGTQGFNGSNEKVKESIAKIVAKATSREEAEEKILLYFNRYAFGSGNKYADKTAVHLAVEIVADDLYGGEKGNEVFAIYPADFIASQYGFSFSSGENSFTRPASENKWNDVFVYADRLGKGLSLDAGIVFLPASTLVDPQTGSRYQSLEIAGVRQRVENTEVCRDVVAALMSETFSEYRVLPRLENSDYARFANQFRTCLAEKGVDTLLVSDHVCKVILETLRYPKDNCEADLFEKFQTYQILYKTVGEQGVSSRDFWEKYFNRFPSQKPAHVVFYDGEPTEAVRHFLHAAGVEKRNDTPYEDHLGFEKNAVSPDDARANVERGRLDALCEEVLQERFG